MHAPLLPSTRFAGPLSVSDVPVTLTGSVVIAVPAFAVTVIVRLVGSVPAFNVALAKPLASVTAWVTVSTPDVTANVTVTPARAVLFASRSSAVMLADFDPSKGICGLSVWRLTVCWIATTPTVVLPLTLPVVAVIVRLVPAAALMLVSVAVALPLVSVVPLVTVIAPPAELANVTVTPLTPALFASSAVAVIVDDVLPSAATVAGDAFTVTDATPLPPPPPPLWPVSVSDEPPPQPASSTLEAISAPRLFQKFIRPPNIRSLPLLPRRSVSTGCFPRAESSA